MRKAGKGHARLTRWRAREWWDGKMLNRGVRNHGFRSRSLVGSQVSAGSAAHSLCPACCCASPGHGGPVSLPQEAPHLLLLGCGRLGFLPCPRKSVLADREVSREFIGVGTRKDCLKGPRKCPENSIGACHTPRITGENRRKGQEHRGGRLGGGRKQAGDLWARMGSKMGRLMLLLRGRYG